MESPKSVSLSVDVPTWSLTWQPDDRELNEYHVRTEMVVEKLIQEKVIAREEEEAPEVMSEGEVRGEEVAVTSVKEEEYVIHAATGPYPVLRADIPEDEKLSDTLRGEAEAENIMNAEYAEKHINLNESSTELPELTESVVKKTTVLPVVVEEQDEGKVVEVVGDDNGSMEPERGSDAEQVLNSDEDLERAHSSRTIESENNLSSPPAAGPYGFVEATKKVEETSSVKPYPDETAKKVEETKKVEEVKPAVVVAPTAKVEEKPKVQFLPGNPYPVEVVEKKEEVKPVLAATAPAILKTTPEKTTPKSPAKKTEAPAPSLAAKPAASPAPKPQLASNNAAGPYPVFNQTAPAASPARKPSASPVKKPADVKNSTAPLPAVNNQYPVQAANNNSSNAPKKQFTSVVKNMAQDDEKKVADGNKNLQGPSVSSAAKNPNGKTGFMSTMSFRNSNAEPSQGASVFGTTKDGKPRKVRPVKFMKKMMGVSTKNATA